eukprot:249567_1
MILPNATRQNALQNEYVFDKINNALINLDKSFISTKSKLKIIYFYLYLIISYDLIVYELAKTSLNEIDLLIDKYLKKYIGLPKSTNNDMIHHPNIFKFPKISDLYIKSKSNALVALYHSIDSNINNVLIAKESRLSSYNIQTFNFEIINDTKSIINKYYTENNMNRNDIINYNNSEDDIKYDEHDLNLSIISNSNTNDHFQQLPLDTEDIHTLLFDIPDYIRPFYSRSSQSILHVLNNCSPALHQGRYTWRHDNVLNHMYKELKFHVDKLNNNNNMSIFQLFADLPNKRYNANSTLPETLLNNPSYSSLKPDLVMVECNNNNSNEPNYKVSLIELTVPYETNISKRHRDKINRYTNLCNHLNSRLNVDCKLICFEIGSRGIFSKDNTKRLERICNCVYWSLNRKTLRRLKSKVQKLIIKTSYKIFKKRNDKHWTEESFISEPIT